MPQYVYEGIFVEEEQLYSKLKGIIPNNRLEHVVKALHVTCHYRPKISHQEFYGSKVRLKILGYGNNGLNEGIRVEIDSQNPQFKSKNEVPHITLSYADTSSPKATIGVEFTDIEEVTITGVFGGYMEDGTILTSKPKRETSFIIPVYVENTPKIWNKMDLQIWEQNFLNLRYLAMHVREVFEDSNSITKIFSLTPEQFEKYVGIGLDKDLVYQMGDHRFSIAIHNLKYFSFRTGIGFVIVSVQYDNSIALEDMCEISKNLEYLMAEKRGAWRLEKNGEDIKLGEKIRQLFQETVSPNAVWFASSSNQKSFLFHRVVQPDDSNISQDKNMITALMRGLGVNAISDNTPDMEANREIINPMPNIWWGIDSMGIVSLAYANGENGDFIENAFQTNVLSYYLPLYILALHERESLLFYNAQAVKNWRANKELYRIKEEIVGLNIWTLSNTVSIETGYQQFYEKLNDHLRLDKLENDILQVVQNAEELSQTKKERKVNFLLGVIGVLSIISAFTDGWSLVENIYGLSSTTAIGIVVPAIVIVGVILLPVLLIIWLWKH